jgi:hypothetical protein
MIEYRSLAVQWKCQSLPCVLPGSFLFAGPLEWEEGAI